MPNIKKILVANRGEIAVRVIRACRDLGLESVAIYSEADREALHVRYADFSYPIGPAPAVESYLCIDKILDVAAASGADAVHPGYGFLAENPEFAKRCTDAGFIFIGPTPECMALVGDKAAARKAAIGAGVPVVPGSPAPVEDAASALEIGREFGFPLMLKAAAGGGGKGMRKVDREEDLESAFRSASSEASSAFADGRIYVEKAIETPRHIEIQILADTHDNLIHLAERECTLQRRHQKVLEEAPSPVVDATLRAEMGAAALAVAEASGYTNAGTVEFIVDKEMNYFFIEVNARLQVEHPVTEVLTGVDLVAEQIAIAEGKELTLRQEDILFNLRGHAIECRIYAEDPSRNFAPSPGTVEALRIPGGPGVRDDSCLFKGYEVPIHYDPIVGKLIAWGPDRPAAIRRMRRALEEYKVCGIATTVPLFLRVLSDPEFIAGDFDTGYLDRLLSLDRGGKQRGGEAPVEAADDAQGPAAQLAGGHHSEAEIAEVARLAAALHVYLREEERAFQQQPAAGSAWKRAGRLAALEKRR
jgi:acetyl-CoA carboxylase biotin carboxylase subunit